MSNSNHFKSIVTYRVDLSPDRYFVLFLIVGEGSYGKKYLLDLRLGYKNQFVSNSHVETKYFLEGMSIFAEKDNANISCDEFEIVQTSVGQDAGTIRKSLLCKFLKTDIPDKAIYLNRVMCRTIYSGYHDFVQNYSKYKLVEHAIHEKIYLIMLNFKTNDPSVLQNSRQHLEKINNKDVPREIQKALKKYLGIEDE